MILRKMEKILLAVVFFIGVVLMATPLSASASTSDWLSHVSPESEQAREVRYDVKEREVTVTLVTGGFKEDYFCKGGGNTNAWWCVYFTDGKNNYKLECQPPNEAGFHFYTMDEMKAWVSVQVEDGWLGCDCSYSVNGNELTWVATLPERTFTDPINVNAVQFTGYYEPYEIMELSEINSLYRWSLDENGTATLRGDDGDIPFFWLTAVENYDKVKSIDVDVDWLPVRENLFAYLPNLETVKIKADRVYGDSMYGMFKECVKLREVDLSGLNTANVNNMGDMFYSCMALTKANLSGLNTDSVESMVGMFQNCRSLSTIDLSSFRTPKLMSMGWMFFQCASLTSLDVSMFDTSNVTNMHCAFACGYSDYNEEDYSETWHSKLKSIKLGNFNTSKVVDASNMFQGCIALTDLDVSSFDTSKMENLNAMFYQCQSLKSLDLSNFITSSATEMISLFYGCSSLESVNLNSFDTSNVTNVNFMFNDCNSLKSLDLSSFDLGKVTDAYAFLNLYYDNALQTICTPKNLLLDCHIPMFQGLWMNESTGEYEGYLPKNETSSKTLVLDRKERINDLYVSKKSLALFDTIVINFKVDKSVMDQYHDLYLVASQGGTMKKLDSYTEDGDYLVFEYRVAPQAMNEEVEAIPCATNAQGENVMGISLKYSVAEYCYNMLGKEKYQTSEYANFRRLLVDILRYGDAAQVYDNYKTDELAGSNLTAEMQAMGTDVSIPMSYENVKLADYETVTDVWAEITNAALYLEAAVNVQFKFTANSLEGLTVVISDGTQEIKRFEPDSVKIDTNGRYYVTFGELNAGEMRKTIYATVIKGNKKVSNTYRYSIESYVASMKGNHGEKLDNLLDAMMRYGDAAAKYAGITK